MLVKREKERGRQTDMCAHMRQKNGERKKGIITKREKKMIILSLQIDMWTGGQRVN